MILTAALKRRIDERPLKTVVEGTGDLPVRVAPPAVVPESFNGIEVWKGVLSPIRNQLSCGSCYAFASTGSLSDRFNILSGARMHVVLSASKIVLCDWGGLEYSVNTVAELEASEQYGKKELVCHGNTLESAYRYLFTIGSPLESCFPDSLLDDATATDATALCSVLAGPIGDNCTDGSYGRFYRCVQYYAVPAESMQREILQRGPLSSAMRVYPNFYTFDPKTEIYTWDGKGEQVGGHAVKIVGWGVDKGTDFWWVANSWGKGWGLNGYFRMERNCDACGIENNAIGALPDFFFGSMDRATEFYNREFKVVPDDAKYRSQFENPGVSGGGIDPRTGYVRHLYRLQPRRQLETFRVDWALPYAADVRAQPARAVLPYVLCGLFGLALVAGVAFVIVSAA